MYSACSNCESQFKSAETLDVLNCMCTTLTNTACSVLSVPLSYYSYYSTPLSLLPLPFCVFYFLSSTCFQSSPPPSFFLFPLLSLLVLVLLALILILLPSLYYSSSSAFFCFTSLLFPYSPPPSSSVLFLFSFTF